MKKKYNDIIALAKYDYDKLDELHKVDEIFAKLGLEKDFFIQEVSKLNLIEAMPFIKSFYNQLEDVYCEIENEHAELFDYYQDYLNKTKSNSPFTSVEMNKNGKTIVESVIKNFNNQLSIKIVNSLIADISFKKLGVGCGYLEVVFNKIMKLQNELEVLWNQRYTLYNCLNNLPEISNSLVRKFHWEKSEDGLINLFAGLANNGFIRQEDSQIDSIANHFTIHNRIKIPTNSNTLFNKIVWMKDDKDLYYLMNVLFDSNSLEYYKARHKLFIQHFKSKDGEYVHKHVSDFSNQLKSHNKESKSILDKKRYNINPAIEDLLRLIK